MEAVCGGGRGRKVALIYAPVKKKGRKRKKKKKLPIRGPFDAPRGILEALMTIAYEKRKGLRTLGSLLFGIGG